jgi:Ca2+-binding RTX toxin-like protein
VNDDQFEPTDSSLFDFRLPADGTYIVEVDTFSSATTPHTDTGSYELFMYRFESFNANDGGDLIEGRGGNDNLIGGLGNDTLNGGSGNDLLIGGSGNDVYAGLPAGNDTLLDSAGRDTLNFAAAAQGINLNLSLSAGQVQTVNAAGDKLALNGTLENVFGTALADSLTGNSADNVLVGGAGNDTLAGGDGNDLLIGGLGADSLQGQAGDDLLIGGTTTFDSNQAALDAIEAEWSSGDTYAQRVAYLTGAPGGANGSVFLISGTTVLNDNNAKDTLLGGAGMDLFFKFGGDMLSDKENGETIL